MLNADTALFGWLTTFTLFLLFLMFLTVVLMATRVLRRAGEGHSASTSKEMEQWKQHFRKKDE